MRAQKLSWINDIEFQKWLCVIGWLSQVRETHSLNIFFRHPVHVLNPGSHSECTLFLNMLYCTHFIPIYKGSDNDNPVNYRPIALLSIFDKIFEKIKDNRLQSLITKNKVLYKFQYGFRKNHATTHALIDIMEYIYNSLDEGKYVFGTFIDLKCI